MKKTILFILTLAIFCALIGCGSTRQVTQLVRDVHTDTLYLSNIQYDSIYITQDKLVDRYKLLKDTIRVVERDSIPYHVTVTEVKEITRPLTLYDKTCRACFWFLLGILGFHLIRFILKLCKL